MPKRPISSMVLRSGKTVKDRLRKTPRRSARIQLLLQPPPPIAQQNKTKQTKIKAVKVVANQVISQQELQEIRNVVTAHYNTNATTVHKDLRGLIKNPDLARRIQAQRNHILIPIKDRDQCDKTIGTIDCFGLIRCYLCGEPLITHIKNFRQNCRDVYGDLKTTGAIPWLNERNQSIDNDAPECDHIMPCSPVNDDLNGWGLNHILYSLLAKLLKIKGNDIEFSEAQTIEYDISYYNHLKVNIKPYNKLKYFLNAIIKSNYGWTHRICNNKKSNNTCINVVKIPGGVKSYIINDAELQSMSDKFINTTQWKGDIFRHFGELTKRTGMPLLKNQDELKASEVSVKSMKHKMNLICLILNDNIEYETYTPTTTPAQFMKNIYRGGATPIANRYNMVKIHENSSRISDVEEIKRRMNFSHPNTEEILETSEKSSTIDKKKLDIIAEKILDKTGESKKDTLKRLNTFLFLTDIDEIKDTPEYIKVVEELNEIYEDFERSNDESNELIQEVKDFLNYLNRQLPDYKSKCNQDYLQYIKEISNTHEFELFKQLILFDFSKFEKFEFFSFTGNFAQDLIKNNFLILRYREVKLNVEDPKIKFAHYKQTFFFNYFNEKNEIREDKKKSIIDNLRQLNPDIDESISDDDLIQEKLLNEFEERYKMIDDKTKLNDIYINWYYFNIFQLLLTPKDKLLDRFKDTDYVEEGNAIIEEILKIKKIMPVKFSDKFAIKVKEANRDGTKMQELYQDVRRTCFQLSIAHGLLYNHEKTDNKKAKILAL